MCILETLKIKKTHHFLSEQDIKNMSTKITKIGITNDKITGRGGLHFILQYIGKIGLYGLICNKILRYIVVGKKGLKFTEFLKQMFAFFIDGTDTSISGFDHKKTDEGYAALLENTTEEMASSHQIKRMFIKLSIVSNLIFNRILHELFIWRLQISKPTVIKVGVDTMVLDNDQAEKREGCEVTYKQKKGFQPLHISWGSFLIDVWFRKGSAHSNHGTDYIDRVTAIVKLIRKRYDAKVPIIIIGDSGFADQKAYTYFEEVLDIHYITTGKMYNEIKEYAQNIPIDNFSELSKNKVIWKFIEFGNKLKSWTKFRRCILTKLHRDEAGQYIINFERPDNVIYTNIGTSPKADQQLKKVGGEQYFEAKTIVEMVHQRGADELIHRSIKELATKEQLPFQNFGMNRAYYYLMVITHFIFETYKQDVVYDVIPITSYPDTFRRKVIDFAAKITKGARSVVLKVTKTIYETINIEEIWKRCLAAPEILLT